jgi:hypothetical protein
MDKGTEMAGSFVGVQLLMLSIYPPVDNTVTRFSKITFAFDGRSFWKQLISSEKIKVLNLFFIRRAQANKSQISEILFYFILKILN